MNAVPKKMLPPSAETATRSGAAGHIQETPQFPSAVNENHAETARAAPRASKAAKPEPLTPQIPPAAPFNSYPRKRTRAPDKAPVRHVPSAPAWMQKPLKPPGTRAALEGKK